MNRTFNAEIELLAPARDVEVAIAAIDHGADAVYIGAPSHGARSAAANSMDDLRRLCDYAHRFNVRVYATVNTLVYEHELAAVEAMVGELYNIGVDALIVQDMALLKMDIPPIDLHASTQCDIRTPEKARFLADAGFSRIVLPRELSLAETMAIHQAVPGTEIEAFVHGALCVSYSGDCQAGCVASGRSANRGECPQICRLAYDLLDLDGKTLLRSKHLLSLRDLNRSADIEAMIRAGVNSFKIEGRLKDASYVKNVVAAYRRAIDTVLEANPGLGHRTSAGASQPTFTPDVNESFNRGFTPYFTRGKLPQGVSMASLDSPKWCGREVGTVVSQRGGVITAGLKTTLSNGDGLGYYDRAGKFVGFRLNRVEGNRLFAADRSMKIPAGTTLFRNRNKAFDDAVNSSRGNRLIDVNMCLRLADTSTLCLDIDDGRGNRVTATIKLDAPCGESLKDQTDRRQQTLRKLGGTIYRVKDISDRCGNNFIALSVLSQLRRDAVDLLDRSQRVGYQRRLRLAATATGVPDELKRLTYHHNVANSMAAGFYTHAGAEVVESALETVTAARRQQPGVRVMTTRYCLRRELGECLRCRPVTSPRLPSGECHNGDVILRNGNLTLRVEFDCRRCGMNIYTC